ncbi:MAG: DNA-binding protein WhiA [Oscillospiraceae bacterium]
MKSFSRLAKEEIYKSENAKTCCDNAQYAGLLLFGASIDHGSIKFVTENQDVLGSYINISRKLGFEPIVKQISDESVRYVAETTDITKIMQLLADYKLINSSTGLINYRISKGVVARECCKRAFLKGAFLGGGTVIDPQKNYNLEIITSHYLLSNDLQEVLKQIGFEFKTVMRKSKYVLYVKNSELISDVLTYMGAFKSQMALINVKIEKEIRNDVNRSVNGETANMEKTISASIEQIKAIEKVDKFVGLENLPDDLREVAFLRLEHKDLSMGELVNLLNPPLSKSGINHRFKKILEMAK